MARPTKLTPELVELVRGGLREGVPFAETCRYLGIAESTAFEWLARGRGRDRRPATSPYVEFAAAVTSDQSTGEPFAERPQNRAETGADVGFAESAEPGFSDAPDRARARDEEREERTRETPVAFAEGTRGDTIKRAEESSRAWRSKRNRGRAVTVGLADREW